MTLDVKQLLYFVAVADDLQFSSAAARLGVAQSTISEQIKALERRLNTRLFIRTSRSVKLTLTGQHLVVHARQIIDDLDELAREIDELSRGRRGTLRIGAVSHALTIVLPSILRELQQIAPDVDVRMKHASPNVQIQEIRDGKLDAGFVRAIQPNANFEALVILEESLVAVIPADHEFARDSSIALRQLTGQPFVFSTRKSNPAYFDFLLSTCHEHQCVPSKVIEVSDLWTELALVSAGFGVSVVPSSFQDHARKDLAFVSLADQLPSTPLQLIWSPQFAPPALQSLVRATRHTMTSFAQRN